MPQRQQRPQHTGQFPARGTSRGQSRCEPPPAPHPTSLLTSLPVPKSQPDPSKDSHATSQLHPRRPASSGPRGGTHTGLWPGPVGIRGRAVTSPAPHHPHSPVELGIRAPLAPWGSSLGQRGLRGHRGGPPRHPDPTGPRAHGRPDAGPRASPEDTDSTHLRPCRVAHASR